MTRTTPRLTAVLCLALLSTPAAATLATAPALKAVAAAEAPANAPAAGTEILARRGRGADDPAGHNAGDDRGRRHGGHGADDGPNHG
jgi:hypothetical protein